MNDATRAVGTAPDVGLGATDALRALVDVLGREQKLLERLAYAVTQAALLLAAAEERHLVLATDEIVSAVRDVGTIEVARALLVAELAAAWGLDDDDITLQAIQDHAPDAFGPVLAARQADLRRLTEQIATVSDTGRGLAERGDARIAAALAGLHDGAADAGYASDGTALSPSLSGVVADRRA